MTATIRGLSIALLLSGCHVLSSMPIGPPSPPMQPCRLRFEPLTPKVAGDRYRQVGAVCVTADLEDAGSPRQWSDGMRQDFEARACRLGGDVAVPIGFCANQATNGKTVSGTQFGVYRD